MMPHPNELTALARFLDRLPTDPAFSIYRVTPIGSVTPWCPATPSLVAAARTLDQVARCLGDRTRVDDKA